MAKEITALSSVKERNGEVRWRVFYHFPISPRVTDANGVDVVPQSSAGMSADALKHFDQAEQTALKDTVDVGDAGYTIRDVVQTPGELAADFVARIKLDWAATRDFMVQQWRDQNTNTGTQLNIA